MTNYWGELIRVDAAATSGCSGAQIARNGISSAAQGGDQLVVTSYDGSVYLVRPADLAVVNVLPGDAPARRPGRPPGLPGRVSGS